MDPVPATEESVSPELKSDETDAFMLDSCNSLSASLENGLMQSYNAWTTGDISKILNLQNYRVLHCIDVRDFIDKLPDCMERGLESQSHLKAAKAAIR